MESDNEEEIDLSPETEETTPEAPAQGQEEPVAQEAQPQVEKTWFDDLPDELKTNPNITKHKSIESLGKAYVESVKKLGLKGIQPLPENATPEQRAAYNSMRRGENIKSPNDYSYEKGNEDPMLVEIKQSLFNAGADDYMVQEICECVGRQLESAMTNKVAHDENIYAKEDERLRSEWNEDYVVNKKANELMLENRYPVAKQILDQLGATRSADVQMMLRDLNARAGDAQIRFDEARHETFNDKIKRIKSSAAYKNEFHPDHWKARVKIGELYEQQAGELRE